MPRAPRQRPPSPEAPRWTDPAPPRRRGRARPAQPVWGYGADNITTQFVQQFAEAEERERRPRKDPRTAERHAALRKQLSQVSFTPPLALSTKVNMAISLKRWQTYCDLILGLRDWKQALKTTDSKTAIDYLVYMLDSCDIKSSGTSWQYFRQWKQVYYLTLKEEFPKYESDQVRHFHDTIAVAEFHLESPKKREKTVTDSDDLLALLSFNIAYDSHALPSERQRLDVAACYLLLAYTGCRPAELVDGEKKKPKDGTFEELFGQGGVMPEPREGRDDDGDDNELARMLERDTALRRRPKALCYEDIQLMVVPHPKTGRDTLTMSIKFTHHKGSDNKPKP
ncbi:hypothetical protein H0H87_010611 [Tephrocybe sp. NHM501043]|nr:hypothetical protein H0H87_010611 [Tephrocybe sp. NHM501043]